MKERRTILLVILLSLSSMAGIIGMLVVNPLWGDRVLFAVAALPLVCGGWCWRAHRAIGSARSRG